MLNTLRKSKKLYAIALTRLHDYKELLRIEMKLQGRGVGVIVASYALAALFGLLAIMFLGAAIIVAAWDSGHRALVAWLVVVMYAALAGGLLLFARKSHAESALSTLRDEIKHDYDVLKESL